MKSKWRILPILTIMGIDVWLVLGEKGVKIKYAPDEQWVGRIARLYRKRIIFELSGMMIDQAVEVEP